MPSRYDVEPADNIDKARRTNLTGTSAYISMPFVPGDVVALLSKIDDIEPGLYLFASMSGDWAILRPVIDDEVAERLYVTNTEVTLPATLLLLFQSVGLRLNPQDQLPH